MRKKLGSTPFGKTAKGNRSKVQAIVRHKRAVMNGKPSKGPKAHHGVMMGNLGGGGHTGWQNGDGTGFSNG